MSLRIHGEKIIKRRNLGSRSDYHMYLPELREDFHHMCGYCGKTEKITKNAFEIDHFIPRKYAEDRKNDYNNLVYSCYVCNRKKSSKWLSKDSKVQFVDEKGFVDPASEEYNKHLKRNVDGTISGITEAGKYMEDVFQFKFRPTKEIWQLMMLVEQKEKLREKIRSLASDEKDAYIEIDEVVESLQELLFQNKE